VVGGALVGGPLVGGGEAVGAGLAGATVVTGPAESSSDEQAIEPRRRPAAPSVAAPPTNHLPILDGAPRRRPEGSVENGSEVMFMVRV
jgi:hypothetical protein